MESKGSQVDGDILRAGYPPREDLLFRLQEELIPGKETSGIFKEADQPGELLPQVASRLGREELDPKAEGVGRPDGHLLDDLLGGVEPVLDIVVVGEVQSEVVPLLEVQRVEHLVVDLLAQGVFLQLQK